MYILKLKKKNWIYLDTFNRYNAFTDFQQTDREHYYHSHMQNSVY